MFVRLFVKTNMHLFNRNGRIQKYVSALEILEEFIPLRLEFYER